MLTEAEEDRIEEHLPSTPTVESGGETHEYEPTVFWTGGNTSEDYPAVFLEWDTQSEERTADQPVGDVFSVESEEEYVITKGAELVDELIVTVAVEAVRDDRGEEGVPPQTRASDIAAELWELFRFGLDLNHPGDNGERPMLVDVVSPPDPGRVEDTYRVEFAVQFSYRKEVEIVEETVADAEYDVEIE